MKIYLRHLIFIIILSVNPDLFIDVSAQTTSATNIDPFIDVSAYAGIAATHRASWNEHNPFKQFEDGYMAIGQAWGDYDNDGWVDLYVTGNLDENVLYRNNQDGTFSISPLSRHVQLSAAMSGGAVWVDYDNDGWPDLYVLNHGPNTLFRNVRGVAFVDVTAFSGVGDIGKGTTAAWGDYDNDGYLDLFVVNWSCYPKCDPIDHTQARDKLYHNNGDGTFSDVSQSLVYEKSLGSGFAASFVDYDNDGDLDIYVVNDALKNPIGNVLWQNDGSGCIHWCWHDVSAETGTDLEINGMGIAVGDYDNDLDLDLYLSNMVNPMALLQNQGMQAFEDVARESGVAVSPTNALGWGTAFFDYDNNGWLDLYLATTGYVHFEGDEPPMGIHFDYPNYLFQNQGNGQFVDVSPASWIDHPQPSMGLATADYDQDGWVDFVLGNWNEGYRLYQNTAVSGRGNHWLTLKLVGAYPINRDAVGARAYVTDSEGNVQMQEVKIGSSLGAGNETALHFGLGTATVAKIMIRWSNGDEAHFHNIGSDQLLKITYPSDVSQYQQKANQQHQPTDLAFPDIWAIINHLTDLIIAKYPYR